jgi:signal transduction histidine kinase
MQPNVLKRPAIWKSLSVRLLVLTVFFVMLVEVFVYAPSVARYRLVYLQDKLANAHLATVALEAAGKKELTRMLQERLLDHARAYIVLRRVKGQPKRAIMRQMPPPIDRVYDLRKTSFFGLIFDAFETLIMGGDRTLRILGPSPADPKVLMDIVLSEQPLYDEMLAYSWRILLLSILISLITAALVYASLHLLIVRPLKGLTENMIIFRGAPEDAGRMLRPSKREDELGVAQREYAQMQDDLRVSLRQKERLAVLGGAVTRINHDLRNMLSSAQLVSDRLAMAEDPEVKKVAPRLVRAIDRAVELCTQTLDYSSRDIDQLNRMEFQLAALIDEVFSDEELVTPDTRLNHDIDAAQTITADRGQIFRVFANLTHNALQAGATEIKVSIENGSVVVIDVLDNGPGVPEDLRTGLFDAFKKAPRNGGTGLGLAITREIIDAHGGAIELIDDANSEGAHFRITLPQA